MSVLLVLLAGAGGAVVRYFVARLGSRGILAVNVVGSFIAGIALSFSGDLQLIVLTGFCGGLTTFSTFAVETIEFALKGWWRMLVANITLNLVLGVAAAAAGYLLFA